MAKQCRKGFGLTFLRTAVILTCMGGFFYQTSEFMLLYWTYPTVLDIQELSPSYIELPSFSFCNPIGYNFTSICTGFGVAACMPSELSKYTSKLICERFPETCVNGKVPKDFFTIQYGKFMKDANISIQDHSRLSMKLEDYLNCTIEFNGTATRCNMENILGSFYTKEELPQYCYTIYSLWGNPDGKRENIPKAAIMKFRFFLNTSNRAEAKNPVLKPAHNLPSSPSVQIAVHSPYFLPSPYVKGKNFIGGSAYEIRVTLEERHLLPLPYQTNCTDYLKMWQQRSGRAPINQLSVIQECRLNRTYDVLKCVPVTLDYPHAHSICPACSRADCGAVSTDECTLLSEKFNQPCDSYEYFMTKTLKEVNRYAGVVNLEFGRKEKRAVEDLDHDCSGNNFWRQKCSYIEIDVFFDRFVIKNLTYKAKYESLELFSVIGGYLGMWLGVSLLNVYDISGFVRNFIKKAKKKLRARKATNKNKHRRIFEHHRSGVIKEKDHESMTSTTTVLWTSYM